MAHSRTHIDNFHIGQDASITIFVEDADGNDVDMSAGSATFTLMPVGDRKQKTENVNVMLQKTTAGGGITIVDGPTGELRIDFETSDTESMSPTTAWYRIDTVSAGGDEVPGSAAGRFELTID